MLLWLCLRITAKQNNTFLWTKTVTFYRFISGNISFHGPEAEDHTRIFANHQNLICSISTSDLHPSVTQERKRQDRLMLSVCPSLFNNSSERSRGRVRRKRELTEGESTTGCNEVGTPVYDFCITGAWCQTFSPWKECLPNQFHVNGLGGNHSPLFRLRGSAFKTHTKGEICKRWRARGGKQKNKEPKRVNNRI